MNKVFALFLDTTPAPPLNFSDFDSLIQPLASEMAPVNSAEEANVGYYQDEDELWMRNILDLIPRSLCGGQNSVKAKLGKLSKANAPETKQSSKPKKRNRRRKKQDRAELDTASEDDELKRLRQKLKQKIADKRAERKADDEKSIQVRNERKRKREEAKADKAKKRRKENRNKAKKDKQSIDDENQALVSNAKDSAERTIADAQKRAEPTVETTRLSGFASDEERPRKSKRRKLSRKKLGELQKQLEIATKEKEDKEVLSKSTTRDHSKSGNDKNCESVSGEEISDRVKERELEKAIQRVRGDSVKDDVGKIRKSIRKEKRKHEKSKEEWAKRLKAVEDDKRSRQEQRKKNLKERRESRTGGKKRKAGKHHKKKG